MALRKIPHVRTIVVRGGGAHDHDQGEGYWIDDHIATSMARFPEYRQSPQEPVSRLLGEPVRLTGRIRASELAKPGFGVVLNRDIPLPCPYTH